MIICFHCWGLKTFVMFVQSCGYLLWSLLKCICLLRSIDLRLGSIKHILKTCYRWTAWQNQERIALKNICHDWTEGLWALFLQHDQSQLHLCNWLYWDCTSPFSLLRSSLNPSSDPVLFYALGTTRKDTKHYELFLSSWIDRTELYE